MSEMLTSARGIDGDRIARLERRLLREREARREAERIADRGMRELWIANRDLDARVAERTADLEAALAELELASTARERFLATLSHEMRTPLNGVLGMLELLGAHTVGEQGRNHLRSASESANRLNQLLSRLLDLVELDSGDLKAELHPVDPAALAREITDRWQMPALRTGHLLVLTSFLAGETLHIDVRRVRQIVDELLDNAITHADRGAVHLRLLRAGEDLVIEVEDVGPGIAAHQIERLFSDFTMVDATTARAQQGLGLGLGLSRRLAEALGGSLELESHPPRGSIATLRVPAGLDEEHRRGDR
jgi:signal transduction histidine kinase